MLAEVNSHLSGGSLVSSNALHFQSLNRLINVAHVAHGWLEVLGASLACNFEPADLGLVVVDFWWQDDGHGVVHEEYLGEARSEARSINVDLARLGEVDLFAPGAEVLKARCLESISETNRNDFLAVTESSWACSIDSIQKLLVHFGQASRGQSVASMD